MKIIKGDTRQLYHIPIKLAEESDSWSKPDKKGLTEDQLENICERIDRIDFVSEVEYDGENINVVVEIPEGQDVDSLLRSAELKMKDILEKVK